MSLKTEKHIRNQRAERNGSLPVRVKPEIDEAKRRRRRKRIENLWKQQLSAEQRGKGISLSLVTLCPFQIFSIILG